MSFEPLDYLRHILVEVEYLLDQSQGRNFERFAADATLQLAHALQPEVEADPGLARLYREIDLPLAEVLYRMERAGAVMSSTEMMIYELLGKSGTPEFKAMLPFLKQQ